MALSFTLLYGSFRADRKGIRLVRFLDRFLSDRGHRITVLDAAELRLPMLDRMYKEHAAGEAPEPMESVAEALRGADGHVVVAGEYNHGIQPGLKNLLDHFLEEWFYRPSAIACYSAGGFGGVRAAMQLRMTLAELGMPSLPTLLPIPKIQDAFDEVGQPQDPKTAKRAGAFAEEIEWYARALKTARAAGLPGD